MEITKNFIKAFFLSILLTQLAFAQDWPRFRGDVALSGRTETRVAANNIPTNFLEFQLGSSQIQPLVADLDNDTLPEVISLQQGRLVAASQDGTILINKFFAVTEVVSVTNLDNDSSAPEIIALDTLQRNLLIINADGNLRWQFQFPEFATLASIYIKVADVSVDFPGKELVIFPDHTKTQLDANGYFFSSEGFLYSKPVVSHLFGGQLNFPQIAISDIDNDGTQEIVVVGRPRLMVFAGNGQLKQQLDFREGDPEGRHYGLLSLADVNGDNTLEAVIIADDIPALADNNKASAITVLQLTPFVKRLWGTTFPLPQVLRAPIKAVQDLDKDGRNEIVVNVWDGATQETRIYRGDGDQINLGQPMLLASIPSAYVWDLADLNNDGTAEFLASIESVSNPTLTLNSALKLYRPSVVGNSYKFIASGKSITASYLLNRPNMAGDEFINIGSSEQSRSKALILATPLPRFLTYSNNGIGSINFQERFLVMEDDVLQKKLKVKTDLDIPRPGIIRAILSTALNNEKFLINLESSGQLTGDLSIYQRSRNRLRIVGSPVQVGSAFSTQVRVANLDEDRSNEILVRSSGGRILVLSLDEQNNSLIPITSFAGTTAPIIQALDGNNKSRPQIITTVNDNGRLRLVVYDTKGTIAARNFQVVERFGTTFSDISANTEITITTGWFSGMPNRVDIFLASPRGRSIMLSGVNGSIVWTRSDVFTFGNHVSVRDFNQDGKDDIYIVSNSLYRILNGGLGNELVGPINVASFGGDFNSTPILSGSGEVLLVGPATVVKITDQGKLLWNFSKTIDGKPSQRQASNLLMGLAKVSGKGTFDIIGGNYGENDSFYTYDYFTGLLKLKTPYQPITDIVSIDLDLNGQDEFVFGTANGQVVAINSQDATLVWSIQLDSFPSDPIIAVVGESRKPMLLFAPGNGTLRLYQIGVN